MFQNIDREYDFHYHKNDTFTHHFVMTLQRPHFSFNGTFQTIKCALYVHHGHKVAQIVT